MTNKHANRTQKKEKDEAGLAIESVKANKKLESKKVYEKEAQPKPKLTKELESPTQLESSETWREYGFVSSSPSMTMMHREEPGLLPSCE